MQRTAEVIMDQGHQIVRLPEGISIASDQVSVSQNSQTGEVTLSPLQSASREETWGDFFRQLDEIGPVEEEFLSERNKEMPSSRLNV